MQDGLTYALFSSQQSYYPHKCQWLSIWISRINRRSKPHDILWMSQCKKLFRQADLKILAIKLNIALVMFTIIQSLLNEMENLPNNRINSITEPDALPVGKHATLNAVSKSLTLPLLSVNHWSPLGKSANSSPGSLDSKEI